ncbi:MAG: hypothetical protein H0U76_04170, partial [Ktedonobacteraceae bacterium]|nr:hypothetical protein [Ktedonobacteraceae bacterium]
MIGSHLFPQQKSDVNPRLIIANHIIQLTALEIEQAIVQELDTNPALEMVERMVCPLCNGPLQAGYCRQCNRTGAEEEESHSFIGYSLSEAAKHGDEPFDPLAAVPAPLSLPEQLFAQLRLFVDKKDHEIAFHLVGNLDEHGYLAISIEELVQSLHVDATRIFPVLHELQQLDPAGVGARDLRECLLLQTERLNALGSAPPAATRAIIQNHLAELGHHQFERIRSMLN